MWTLILVTFVVSGTSTGGVHWDCPCDPWTHDTPASVPRSKPPGHSSIAISSYPFLFGVMINGRARSVQSCIKIKGKHELETTQRCRPARNLVLPVAEARRPTASLRNPLTVAHLGTVKNLLVRCAECDWARRGLILAQVRSVFSFVLSVVLGRCLASKLNRLSKTFRRLLIQQQFQNNFVMQMSS